MKNKAIPSNPIATAGGILTLTIIAVSARHCMKKYGPGKKKKLFRKG